MKKSTIFILAVVVLLAIIGVFIYALFPNSPTSDNSSAESSLNEEGSDTQNSTTEENSHTPQSVSPDLQPTARVEIETRRRINAENYVSCSVKVYDKAQGGNCIAEDSSSQIKIRGNSTSVGAKKPYNIKFSQKTDLFGFGENTRWSLLANCYDKSLIRNQTVYDFASAIGLAYTPSYRVAEVYLNGKLQGCYLLCDPIDVSENRIDIDNEGNDAVIEYVIATRNEEGIYYFTSPTYGYRFAIREPESPTSTQRGVIKTFIKKAELSLKSGDYQEVQKYFDIDSMVNFYIVNELFKNVDIAIGSTFFYIKDEKIYGGPVWDFDLSSGNCSYEYFNYYEYNNIQGQGNGSGNNWEGIYCDKLWFQQLLSYPEFQNAVINRYKELDKLIESIYRDSDSEECYIDKITSYYGEAFSRNYKEVGWSINQPYSDYERQNPGSTYESNVGYFKGWLEKRHNWLKNNWNIN